MTRAEKVVFISEHFKTPHTRNKWMRVIDELGITPDKILASRINVTNCRVCTVRRAMGIAPVTFSGHCEHYGAVPPQRPITLM